MDSVENATTTLTTARLRLLALHPDLAELIAAYRLRNSEHFAMCSPLRPDAYHHPDAWRARLQSLLASPQSERSAFGFALQQPDVPQIIGHVDFTQIARGAFQSCYLGYGIDRHFEGRGLMFEALRAAIDSAFSTGLHRIQANHLPTNTRSATLLSRLGFHTEGHARNYLFINGQWQDHTMTALLNPKPITPDLT
jgi:ribosomal-protein-alanine N-acetyltransferase